MSRPTVRCVLDAGLCGRFYVASGLARYPNPFSPATPFRVASMLLFTLVGRLMCRLWRQRFRLSRVQSNVLVRWMSSMYRSVGRSLYNALCRLTAYPGSEDFSILTKVLTAGWQRGAPAHLLTRACLSGCTSSACKALVCMHAASYPQPQVVFAVCFGPFWLQLCDGQGCRLAAFVRSLTFQKILDVRVPVFVIWAPRFFRGQTNIYSCRHRFFVAWG